MPELQWVGAKLCGRVGMGVSARAIQRSSEPPQSHSWGPKAASAAFQILPESGLVLEKAFSSPGSQIIGKERKF